MFRAKKGQSTLEYALIIAAIVAALLAINLYMQKGMQGRLKQSTDEIGRQFIASQADSNFTISWTASGDGLTNSTDTRNPATGNTNSTINAGETITRSEYDDWGTAPTQHAY